eukprot:m51a1_g9606 hypothetical protein (828) ;mRNA; f:1060659-1063701
MMSTAAAARPSTAAATLARRQQQRTLRREETQRWLDGELNRIIAALRRSPDRRASGALAAAKRRGVVDYDGPVLLSLPAHASVVVRLLSETIPETCASPSPSPKQSSPRAAAVSPPPSSSPRVDRCAACSGALCGSDRVYATPKMAFHKRCFTCAQCGVALRPNEFCVVRRRVYCRPHFSELFRSRGADGAASPADESPRLPTLRPTVRDAGSSGSAAPAVPEALKRREQIVSHRREEPSCAAAPHQRAPVPACSSGLGSGSDRRTCPHCGRPEASADAKFCTGCGKTMPVKEPALPTCASCGTPAKNPGDRFCTFCGKPYQSSQSQSPGHSPTPAAEHSQQPAWSRAPSSQSPTFGRSTSPPMTVPVAVPHFGASTSAPTRAPAAETKSPRHSDIVKEQQQLLQRRREPPEHSHAVKPAQDAPTSRPTTAPVNGPRFLATSITDKELPKRPPPPPPAAQQQQPQPPQQQRDKSPSPPAAEDSSKSKAALQNLQQAASKFTAIFKHSSKTSDASQQPPQPQQPQEDRTEAPVPMAPVPVQMTSARTQGFSSAHASMALPKVASPPSMTDVNKYSMSPPPEAEDAEQQSARASRSDRAKSMKAIPAFSPQGTGGIALPPVGREWDMTNLLTQYLWMNGTLETDIFRTPLFPDEVAKLWEEIDGRALLTTADLEQFSCNTISICLKRVLVSREPLIPSDMHGALQVVEQTSNNKDVRLLCMSELVSKIPIGNAVILYRLLMLLNEVAENAEVTGSDASALGYTFGPVLIRPKVLPANADPKELQKCASTARFANRMVQDMIEDVERVFEAVPPIMQYHRAQETLEQEEV